MVLLLVPAITLGALALGGVIEVLKDLDGGRPSDVVRHAFFSACTAAGAVALATIATGRLA